jgi:hypothetical protein
VSKRDTKPEGRPTAEKEPKLSLEDTIAQKLRGVPTKTRTGVIGYNPYDAEPAAKGKPPGGKPKPTDLRKLSEWIRLQRQVAELNPDAPRKKPTKPT